MKIFSILLLSSLFLTACNNQGVSRVGAQSTCKPDKDPASFELTEKEVKDEIFEAIAELPADLNLNATTMIATIRMEDTNSNEITMTLVNTALANAPALVTANCGLGFLPESVSAAPYVFDIPLTNADNKITSQQTSVNFGDSSTSPYLDITTEALPEDPTPQSYTDYFTAKGGELLFFEPEGDDDKGQFYYIHYKNDADKINLRLTLTNPDFKK